MWSAEFYKETFDNFHNISVIIRFWIKSQITEMFVFIEHFARLPLIIEKMVLSLIDTTELA